MVNPVAFVKALKANLGPTGRITPVAPYYATRELTAGAGATSAEPDTHLSSPVLHQE